MMARGLVKRCGSEEFKHLRKERGYNPTDVLEMLHQFLI